MHVGVRRALHFLQLELLLLIFYHDQIEAALELLLMVLSDYQTGPVFKPPLLGALALLKQQASQLCRGD